MKKLGKAKKRLRRRDLAVFIGTGALVASFSPQAASAAAGPTAVQQQTPAISQGQGKRTFRISAQPLILALARFSELTGIRVVYDANELRGITAHAIDGQFTPDEALRALLEGTPVVYRFVDATSVRFERVIGHVQASTTPARTSLSKFTSPLLRTPQSVTEIPSEVIAQRNATTFAEVMRNASGISLSAGEGGAQGDAMTIRGFTSSGDIYLDGVRDFGEYYRDPFDLSSVEVAEGPSSTIVGPGSAGGFINQVTKKPQLQPLADTAITGTSNQGERVTFDVDEPLGSQTAFRIDAMQNAADVAGRNDTNIRRWGIAPSIEFGLGTSTRVLLAYEHLTEHDIPDYGIPYLWGAPAPVPRQNYYGFSNDEFDESSNIATATIEHDLNSNLTLRNITRSASYDRTFRAATASFTSPPPAVGTPLDSINVTRQEHAENGDDDFFDNQTDLIGQATTGKFHHSFDAGIEIGSENGHDIRPSFAGLPGTSLVDPNENQPITYTSETIGSNAHVNASTFGAYALDSIQLGERWELNGGLRWDDFAARDTESVTHANATQEATATTGHAGLVYDVAPNGTVYFSYATSFDPVVDDLVLTQAASLVPPEFDESYELGSKWEFLGGKFSLRGALFRERADNVALSEDSYTSTTVLIGNEMVSGGELEAEGQISQRWSFRADYTLLNGSIVEADQTAALGNELVNVPRNSLSLWSTYDLPDRWQVGLGANGLTARFARPSPSASTAGLIPEVPGYWRLDAMAKAPLTSTLDAQLNLYNLTNKEYYDAVYTDHVIPGAGFSAAITIVKRFQ